MHETPDKQCNLYVLFSGLSRSVLGKSVPVVLSTARGRRARGSSRTALFDTVLYHSLENFGALRNWGPKRKSRTANQIQIKVYC